VLRLPRGCVGGGVTRDRRPSPVDDRIVVGALRHEHHGFLLGRGQLLIGRGARVVGELLEVGARRRPIVVRDTWIIRRRFSRRVFGNGPIGPRKQDRAEKNDEAKLRESDDYPCGFAPFHGAPYLVRMSAAPDFS
jgi:hypothetical protein